MFYKKVCIACMNTVIRTSIFFFAGGLHIFLPPGRQLHWLIEELHLVSVHNRRLLQRYRSKTPLKLNSRQMLDHPEHQFDLSHHFEILWKVRQAGDVVVPCTELQNNLTAEQCLMAMRNFVKFEFEVRFEWISCIGTAPRKAYITYLLGVVHILPENEENTALHKHLFEDQKVRFPVTKSYTVILVGWSDSPIETVTVCRFVGSPSQDHRSRLPCGLNGAFDGAVTLPCWNSEPIPISLISIFPNMLMIFITLIPQHPKS